MKYSRHEKNSTRKAALLIDYDNLLRLISVSSEGSETAESFVNHLVDEVRRYASEQLHVQPVRTLAFASAGTDSSSNKLFVDGWLANGIEPRLTYSAISQQASSIELTIEACRILHSSDNIEAFVLVSGDNWFVPLTQELQRHGKYVMVSCIDAPTEDTQLPSDVVDAYFDAAKLLARIGMTNQLGGQVDEDDESLDGATLDDRRPQNTQPIENDGAREVLEIIEQFFGQYDEVYLTPLLRKLTELVDHEDGPKVAVNYLEECGVVWLEKRRGFPHNYTVLMVNPDHPDVQEIKTQFAAIDTEEDDYFDDEVFEDEDEQEHEYVGH